MKKLFSIGICVRYGNDCFTLAFVIFKPKGDIVLSQHYGDIYRLPRRKKKFDPHVTYHANGVYHVKSYGKNDLPDVNKQPLDENFRGYTTPHVQGFGRDYAKQMGRVCEYDEYICVNAEKIRDKIDIINDNQGRIETHLPTASFRIDLIEPETKPSLTFFGRIIKQKLFKQSFPWCLVSILDLEPPTHSFSVSIDS